MKILKIYKKELIENLYLKEIFYKFKDDVSKYSEYKNKIENNVQYQIIYSVIRDKGEKYFNNWSGRRKSRSNYSCSIK